MMWGKLAIINLYECSPKLIKNKSAIKEFITEICKEINMKKFGSTKVKKFGEGKLKGYSAFQFIETSSIIIHFDEQKNRAFIDLFSCKDFNSKKAGSLSKKFFKAKKAKIKTILRI